MTPAEDPVVLCTVERRIATLTLHRPAALNALDYAMMDALVEHTAALAARTDLRCVVLRGAGRHFMAGGDLRAFASRLDMPGPQRTELFTRMVRGLNAALEHIDRMPCPVIGVAHGAVAGFGLALIAACDLAVASEDAYFSSAYRHVALTPDGGMSWFLPRLVGMRRALAIILLGERFDAQEAERIGLVHRVAPASLLDTTVDEIVQKIAAGPQLALQRARRLVRESPSHTLAEQLEAEAIAFGLSTGTDDFAEGIRAFLAKRAPSFDEDPS
jgi:2-(1,2-epoxy-1,2-dihydrophenyl)acetyl-CoA isomerase